MARRVVITGIGVITSIGIGVRHFAAALREGKSGITRSVSYLNEGFACHYLGEIKGFDPDRWIVNQDASNLCKAGKFAVAAARMAIEDAGIGQDTLKEGIGGVCIGTTDGEEAVIEELMQHAFGHERDINPLYIRNTSPIEIAGAIAREFQLQGEVMTVTTACAAGNYAVGYGYDLLQSGEADFMLCGGTDALARKVVAGFARLGSVAPFVCQPFDKERKGLIPGEGACVLLLEPLERALERGARIYAEILGYGLSCDATHMTASDVGGIVRAIRLAHERAGIRPEQVDYVSAHGTGTKHNDANEVRALREVFGERIPPVSSIKSMIGHSFGAASAIGLAAGAIAISHSFLPPTINCIEPDPELNIDCVPNYARSCEVRIVQNNAFAFGGNNAIVILGRHRNGA